MSHAAQYDITITSGDYFIRNFVYKAASIVTDITGYSVKMDLKLRPTDDTAAVATTCVITDAANGAFSCSLTKEQTAALIRAGQNRTKYSYDLELTNTSGNPETIIVGKFMVERGIS